jgi:hypothetical protein
MMKYLLFELGARQAKCLAALLDRQGSRGPRMKILGIFVH